MARSSVQTTYVEGRSLQAMAAGDGPHGAGISVEIDLAGRALAAARQIDRA